MSTEVRAAGGVLWRRVDDVLEVALVHRPKYDDWSLPKGKLEPGEAPVVGAVREVCEETGFDALPGRTLGCSRYRVLDRGRDVEKTVQWWAMRVLDGEFVPGAEVDALRWLPVSSALAQVGSGYDYGPLSAFSAGPSDTTTVLLVRHGSAGDREAWSGPDDARPLDDRGRRQAAALAGVLPVYRPAHVLSAPLVRCVDTVRPTALRLGVPVEPAPEARETPSDSAPLVDLLRRVGAQDRPAVVCSQGGAIPTAVAALSGSSESVPARKGSLWQLSFDGEQLVDAHYTDTFCD